MKKYLLVMCIFLLIIGCTAEVEDHPHEDGLEDDHDDVVDLDGLTDSEDADVSPAVVEDEDSAVGDVPVETVVDTTPAVEESTTKEFTVEAFQFGYEPDVIEVNKGDTVVITAFSRDVGHGLRISEFDVNMKLLDSSPVTETFVADKVGQFRWFCSVPCGKGHGVMEGTLIVN